jgi:amino acid adenylation domain-containing protein
MTDVKAYEASSAQKRLFLINRLLGDGTLYNMPFAYSITGDFNAGQFEDAVKKLAERHETLRTCFVEKDGRTLQKVYEQLDFKLDPIQDSELPVDALIDNFVRPFDLEEVPLWRIALVRLGDRKHLLMFDIHHIIADGVSLDIIFNEIMLFYHGGELEPLDFQYVDYTQWQNDIFRQGTLEHQEKYWLDCLEGDLPQLNLATDFPRLKEADVFGSSFKYEIDSRLSRSVYRLVNEHSATLYVTLLAAYSVLLFKYTGQQDICIGTPTEGRPHQELEKIIGMFVNTLVMRTFPAPDKKFHDFLEEVFSSAFAAYENQDYPFEMLVEKLGVERQLNRNPLFDTLFALQNFSFNKSLPKYQGSSESSRLEFIPSHVKSKAAKFDLSLFATEFADKIILTLEYRASLFKEKTVKRMVDHLITILEAVTTDPEIKIGGISLVSAEEKLHLLDTLNDTTADYPREQTVTRLFEAQVERTPDRTAVVFEDEYVTYEALNEAANRLAGELKARGVGPDSVAGIVSAASIDRIAAIMGVLKSGAAYLPFAPDYPEERIVSILKKHNVSCLLTRRGNWPRSLEGVSLLDITSLMAPGSGRSAMNVPQSNRPGDLLYLIATSGSTGVPKVVMIEHRNMVNLLFFEYKRTNVDYSGRVLQFASIGFDVSAQEIFSTLLAGGELHLVDEERKLDLPYLFSLINRNRINILFFPPSFLRYAFTDPGHAAGFPVSVDHIIAAGEQLVVPDALKRYLKDNRVYLHNHYGPSETHVVSTLTIDPGEEIPDLPTIGTPVFNTRMLVLDETGNLQPPGVPGELCISGDSVGRGYHNRDDLTNERFVESPLAKGNRMYRTGDLVRWLENGQLEFLGRVDRQVKIRGFRIEPGEIENLLQTYNDIKEAVVIDRSNSDGEKYLCAYFVSDSKPDTAELKLKLSRLLPGYMVPSFFVPVDKIPLTANGKVDRGALPEPGDTRDKNEMALPANEIEKRLADIWSGVLDVERDSIGRDSNFFDLGGHSLKATVLVSRIHKALDVKVPLSTMFQAPTLRGLAVYIEESAPHRFVSIHTAEKRDYYPLSAAQKRLFILNEIENSTVYNLVTAFIVEGKLDRARLENAFQSLIRRHESLRTSFQLVNGNAVQCIHDSVEFNVQWQEKMTQETIKNFVHPFDFTRPPLMRAKVVKRKEGDHLLLFDMHHIISDGVSMNVLVNDFVHLYEGKKLPAVRLQYKDYISWQDRMYEDGDMLEQEAFWLEQLKKPIPIPDLPTDFPRQSVQRFEGDAVHFEIDMPMTLKIKQLMTRTGTTLFMVLLAIENILLSIYSEQEDIIVGTPVAGRNHADLGNIIGMFVNTLVMRHYPGKDKTFTSFLQEVKENTLKAFENQDYPFDELVNKLEILKDSGRNPLFDVLFVTENMAIPNLEIEGLKFSPYPVENRIAHLDQVIYIHEGEGVIHFTLEYSTALYQRSTAEEMGRHFLEILAKVVDNPGIELRDIRISHDLVAAQSAILKEDFDSFEF